jgi:hypothetical protein
MDYIMDVVAYNKVPFRVVYGVRNGLSGEPLTDYPVVSFYDRRYDFTEHGQFVSDYHPTTLIDRDISYGLNLYGRVENWSVDRGTMVTVLDWLETLLERV